MADPLMEEAQRLLGDAMNWNPLHDGHPAAGIARALKAAEERGEKRANKRWERSARELADEVNDIGEYQTGYRRGKAEGRKAGLLEAAAAAEEPAGHYDVGRSRLPYWDGEKLAKRLRAMAEEERG